MLSFILFFFYLSILLLLSFVSVIIIIIQNCNPYSFMFVIKVNTCLLYYYYYLLQINKNKQSLQKCYLSIKIWRVEECSKQKNNREFLCFVVQCFVCFHFLFHCTWNFTVHLNLEMINCTSSANSFHFDEILVIWVIIVIIFAFDHLCAQITKSLLRMIHIL